MNEVSADIAPRRRISPLLAILALVLALLALALAAWLLWQQRHVQSGAAARVAQLRSRVEMVERGATADVAQQQALARRMDALESDTRASRDATQGLDQRMHNLEAALGALSDQQLRGHDVLLLDDAEFLLVAERQRLDVMHDTDGALRACRLAEQALAHVQNPAFGPARESTASECGALAQAAPQNQRALALLSSLRQQVPSLQPREARTDAGTASDKDTWSRFKRALGGIVRIRRDDAPSLPAMDANLARELLQLDLAQAQAALLANDRQACSDALARASNLLDGRFDTSQPAAQKASRELAELISAQPASAVETGNALAVLRGLRASHGLQSALPAPVTSSGGRPQ